MATTDLMTAEELMNVSDGDCRHELVRGELVSLPFNSAIHGLVAANLCGLLWDYTIEHPEFRALAGVRLLWYVDSHLEIVHVYTPDYEARIHQRGDILSGDEVLPDFSVQVDEIFE